MQPFPSPGCSRPTRRPTSWASPPGPSCRDAPQLWRGSLPRPPRRGWEGSGGTEYLGSGLWMASDAKGPACLPTHPYLPLHTESAARRGSRAVNSSLRTLDSGITRSSILEGSGLHPYSQETEPVHCPLCPLSYLVLPTGGASTCLALPRCPCNSTCQPHSLPLTSPLAAVNRSHTAGLTFSQGDVLDSESPAGRFTEKPSDGSSPAPPTQSGMNKDGGRDERRMNKGQR